MLENAGWDDTVHLFRTSPDIRGFQLLRTTQHTPSILRGLQTHSNKRVTRIPDTCA